MTTKRTEAQKWSVTEVLGFRDLHHDPDFAALERDGARLVLHADHTYAAQPWAPRLADKGKRGFGAEIRILGIDPDDVERRARGRGVLLEDPDGYTFAVGVSLGQMG